MDSEEAAERSREAIRAVVKASGLSLSAFAKGAKVGESTIRTFLAGNVQGLTGRTYQKIAAFSGVPVGELMGGAPPEQPDLPALYTGPLEPGVITIGPADFASIPRYDAALSAGNGAILDPHAEPLGYQLFESQWLRAVTNAAPQHLAVVRVAGDSMRDTLDDGDWVLVDRTQKRIDREGIYALQVGESAWIKRISLNLRDRTVRVLSDNPAYQAQELAEDELALIGRVVWIVGRRV